MRFPVEGARKTIKFAYENWRGNYHEYVVEPEAIEWAHYHGDGNGDYEGYQWLLHAQVVTRDDDPRADMGTDRRRSFLVKKIDDLMDLT